VGHTGALTRALFISGAMALLNNGLLISFLFLVGAREPAWDIRSFFFSFYRVDVGSTSSLDFSLIRMLSLVVRARGNSMSAHKQLACLLVALNKFIFACSSVH
jgi:hypothetical protein